MELSEQVFKVIFDNFNGIVIVHNYEGEILLLNDAARKKLFSKAKIKSVKNIKDLLNPENAEHFIYYQHQLLVKKKFEGRYHFTNYKFEKLIFQYQIIPIKSGGKDLIIFQAFDITSLYNTEKDLAMANTMSDLNLNRLHKTLIDLEKAKALAEQSIKIKENFLANISHEIRTPMNGIIGFSDILVKTFPEVKEKKYLHAIKKSASHLLNIINEILDFSKLESGSFSIEKSGFYFDDVLNNIKSIFSLEAQEKNINFTIENDDFKGIEFLGDSGRLQQILVNLVGNAIKFTDEGFVKIILKIKDENEKSCKVYFEVTDSGIGISKKDHIIIFESFTQLNSGNTKKYGGTGLGLTITKQLLKLQQSELNLESELNKGTKFFFEMEFDKIDSSTQKVFKELNKNNYKKNKAHHVLIAEDNDINMLLAEKILMDAGFIVFKAENGRKAIELFNSNKIELILMDVSMPIMNGIEATKIIRKSSNVPIIATTAHASKEDQEKYLTFGFNDYISKPYDNNNLTKKILDLLDNDQSEGVLFDVEYSQKSLFQSLNKLSNGDTKFINGLTSLLKKKIPEILNEMEIALVQKDWEQFKKASHKILPNISLMKLPSLKWIIKIEESKTIINDWDDIERNFYRMKSESENVIKKL
ncbi:MAG: response regulator [Bacteroidota bacterium]|jgi:signal transduction histidine kinase/CheY-like chemotaxis protein/HPt (histidine-containing phosphotransfer) domain-containing protein